MREGARTEGQRDRKRERDRERDTEKPWEAEAFKHRGAMVAVVLNEVSGDISVIN